MWHRGSTSASRRRNPQHAPPHRISSSTCCGLALNNLPLYGRSIGSGSTDLPPFSCALYRITTLFKGGVQPPLAFCGTFQFHRQVLGARLPDSSDCGAQFFRVDALLKFAQDRSVARFLRGLFSAGFFAADTAGITVGSRSRLRVSGVDLAVSCGRVWLPSSATSLLLGGLTSFIFYTIKPLIKYSKESR